MPPLGRLEREKKRDRLERFVLRARKVMAHSLVREQQELLQAVADGTFKISVKKDPETGEREVRSLREARLETVGEAVVARLRPFTMRDEPVYWESVLDAIEDLVPPDIRDEALDLTDLRAAFAGVTQVKQQPQAYSVITESGQMSYLQIANLWLNSDALQAKAIKSAVGQDMDLDHRYQAATGVYARLGAAVNNTLALISGLVREGLLELDEAVFTERVLAETTIDEPLVGGYSAPVGAEPMPTDLSEVMEVDGTAWRPIWEDFEEIIEARKAEAAQRERAASPCRHCRGTGGVQFRGPLTAFDSEYDAYLYELWSR